MLTDNNRSIQGAADSLGSVRGSNDAVDSWDEEPDTIQDGANLRSDMLSGTVDSKLDIGISDSTKDQEQSAAYDTLSCPPPDSNRTHSLVSD